MRSRTSRPSRGYRIAWSALAMGLALVAGSPLAIARQEGLGRQAPGLEPSRPAPGIDTGRAGLPPPGLGQGAAPGAADARADGGRRYHFIEAYGRPEAPGADIGAYQVAFIETLDRAYEVPGEAPQRTQLVSRVITVERPAVVSGLDGREVSALVRYYQSFQLTRDGVADTAADGPVGLVNQTFWLQDQGQIAPLILTLPGASRLTQEQLGFAAFQQINLPKLAGILSPLHVAVGSEWAILPEAAEALIGDTIQGGMLKATFEEVIPAEAGERTSRAVIRISGRVQLPSAITAVNAQLHFAFEDPGQGLDAAEPAQGINTLGPRMLDVRGGFVRLLLAQRDVVEIPDETGRISMRATQLRELNLERRLTVEAALIPELPSPAPSPTRENSWVSFRDTESRFQFEHPQDYRPSPADPAEEETLLLERVRAGGVPDNLTFIFHPRGEVSPELRPDPFVRKMVEGWRALPPPGVRIGEGTQAWLPEAEWSGKRVYRLELPLSYAPQEFAIQDAGEAYSSAYLVQLKNGAALELMGLTEGDPAAFRDEVELILKSFEVDPPPLRASSPAASSPSPAPESSPPPAEEPAAETPAAEPEPEVDVPPAEPEVEVPPIETPGPDPGADRPSRPPPPPFE